MAVPNRRKRRAAMPWKVPSHMPWVPWPWPPNRRSTRSLSSRAALLVKVTARILRASAPSVSQVRQAVGDDARLARAGTGDDQQRLRRIEHGLDLRWVQLAAEHMRREAASRFARAVENKIRRFHAQVIQTVAVAVDRWLAVVSRS